MGAGLTSFQRYVAQIGRPQTPLARRAQILRSLQQQAQTNPTGLVRALELPSTPSGSFIDTAGKVGSAISLALAPAEIAAELALGTNPVTALPLIAFDIASLTGLIPSFSGKPKLLDSVQAIQRLAQSRDPAVQQLAANLAIYVRNGVPLSTSNPQQQAQIRGWIGGAVNTLLSERGLTPTGSNVALLDSAIRNVITSEVANSGFHIDAAANSLGLRTAQPLAQQQQQGLSLRPVRSSRPGPQIAQVPQAQAAQVPSLPENTPSELKRLFQEARQYLGIAEEIQLATCIALVVTSILTEGATAEAATFCLKKLAIAKVFQGAEQIIANMVRFVESLFRNQPQGQPQGQPQPYTTPAPQLQDCPSCTPQGRRLQRQLSQQREQTLRDIQTEQGQLAEQQIAQQAQELSQLEQQETQPAQQRDIAKELEQKQKLLQSIETEQQQLTQVGGQPQEQQQLSEGETHTPAPHLHPSSAEAAQQEIESELQEQHGTQSIQFCVGCKSQEDAILFLNGEPSGCSVIPGSTKEINY